MPKGYTADDAARDTGSSKRDADQAWHEARNAAQSDADKRNNPNDLGYTGDWKPRPMDEQDVNPPPDRRS